MAILSKPTVGGSHWYKPDGTPTHEVPDAKGNLRPTTIRDARKLHLLPSVTNVIGVMGKPGLETWKMGKVALAALSTQRQPGETEDYWAKRVVSEAMSEVSDAADLGTRIHSAIEAAIDGEEYPADMDVYVAPVKAWMAEKKLRVTHKEIVLVNAREGYAGRCDLLFNWGTKGRAVLDWKTRKTEPGKKCEPYDGQAMQRAAYSVAHYGLESLDDVLAANVYISTTEPGRMEIYPHKDLRSHYDAFLHCCGLWRYIKGYDPRIAA